VSSKALLANTTIKQLNRVRLYIYSDLQTVYDADFRTSCSYVQRVAGGMVAWGSGMVAWSSGTVAGGMGWWHDGIL
jgi:hypothetical protein